MENNKKIIGLMAVVILVLLTFLAVLQIRVSRLEKTVTGGGNSISAPNNSIGLPYLPAGSGVSQDSKNKEQLPDYITGTVISIDASQITIKQNSSADIRYMVNKSDIKQIFALQNNPQFNKANLEAKMNESQNNTNSQALKDVVVSPYTNQAVDWSQVAAGELVSIEKGQNGEKNLYIYPKK